MAHQCPFPVRFSDNRRCYRAGSAGGFTLTLLLGAMLLGYLGSSEAAPPDRQSAISQPATTMSSPR